MCNCPRLLHMARSKTVLTTEAKFFTPSPPPSPNGDDVHEVTLLFPACAPFPELLSPQLIRKCCTCLGLPSLNNILVFCVPQRIRIVGHFWARPQPVYTTDSPKREMWCKSTQSAKNRTDFRGLPIEFFFPSVHVWFFFSQFFGQYRQNQIHN